MLDGFCRYLLDRRVLTECEVLNICALHDKYGDDVDNIILSCGYVSEQDLYVERELWQRLQCENSDVAVNALSKHCPQYSAKCLFEGGRFWFLLCLFVCVLLCTAYPAMMFVVVITFFLVLYVLTLCFKTLVFGIGVWGKNDNISRFVDCKINDCDLPVYTILVPLYKEAMVVEQLVQAIKKIDYPGDKLDVKLIVESDDIDTFVAVEGLQNDMSFEIVRVPVSVPKTKPKACNYALCFARGEFVTIYDAEDIPEPLQLRKVLDKFASVDQSVVCVQAKLAFYNWSENILARMFAIEYAVLFEFLLLGLEKIGVPLPLGGTSNHFRIDALRELYAWDPFNVTEDADLGLRIAQRGWRCVMVESETMEECPVSLGAWIRQRSRWIKGHMQTYCVHMRRPIELCNKIGIVGFVGVQLFFGATSIIFIVSPVLWLVYVLCYWEILLVPGYLVMWNECVVSLSLVILVVAVLLHVGYALIVDRVMMRWRRMWLYSFVFPFYWVLHSVASFRALWQLITRPYYWEKTVHGVTKVR